MGNTVNEGNRVQGHMPECEWLEVLPAIDGMSAIIEPLPMVEEADSDDHFDDLAFTDNDACQSIKPLALSSSSSSDRVTRCTIRDLLDVIDAGRQLARIDPFPARGDCILAIVLMKNGQLDEAEEQALLTCDDPHAFHSSQAGAYAVLAQVHLARNDLNSALAHNFLQTRV